MTEKELENRIEMAYSQNKKKLTVPKLDKLNMKIDDQATPSFRDVLPGTSQKVIDSMIYETHK